MYGFIRHLTQCAGCAAGNVLGAIELGEALLHGITHGLLQQQQIQSSDPRHKQAPTHSAPYQQSVIRGRQHRVRVREQHVLAVRVERQVDARLGGVRLHEAHQVLRLDVGEGCRSGVRLRARILRGAVVRHPVEVVVAIQIGTVAQVRVVVP